MDYELEAHDKFIGLKNMLNTDVDSIVRDLKDILLRMHLKLNKGRRECCDGCSTMSGLKSGVDKQIKSKEERALYTHLLRTFNQSCRRRQDESMPRS